MEINLKKASVPQQKLKARQTRRAPSISLAPPSLCFFSFVHHCPVRASAFLHSSCMTLSEHKKSEIKRGFSFESRKAPFWNRQSYLIQKTLSVREESVSKRGFLVTKAPFSEQTESIKRNRKILKPKSGQQCSKLTKKRDKGAREKVGPLPSVYSH